MKKKQLINIIYSSYVYISSYHNDDNSIKDAEALDLRFYFLVDINLDHDSRLYTKYFSAWKRIFLTVFSAGNADNL